MSVLLAATVDKTWHVDPNFLAWLMGFAVPVVVAILAKSSASPVVKAILNAVLDCVAGLLATAIAVNGTIHWQTWGSAIAQAAVASWAMYHGFWKPTGIAPTIHEKTGNYLIG